MVVRGKTLIQKTLFLSASHFAVRSVGFLLRLWLSRELGAQTMGLVELAQSAQMLLITPVVTGLPVAVSRMCAKTEGARRVRVVRCALLLALPVSLLIAALAFLFREPLCLWLGDVQTLPALLCFLPCIPILGASCVLNGYYYGIGQPVPPAVSELLEQIVRALLCVRLVYGLRGWPTLFRAAIPAVATLAGETAGLILMLVLGAQLVLFAQGEGSRKSVFRELLALALPLTGMRLVSSLMQTVNATLIPARLQLFGLSAAEAMASLGVFHGMLKPILFMPSFITCSLSMAAAPELTKRQTDGQPLCTLSTRMILASLAIGAQVEKPAESSVTLAPGLEVYIVLSGLVDFEAERARLEKERVKLAADAAKLGKKLSNPGFLAKAAPEIVEKDRAKHAEMTDKLARVEAQLAELG